MFVFLYLFCLLFDIVRHRSVPPPIVMYDQSYFSAGGEGRNGLRALIAQTDAGCKARRPEILVSCASFPSLGLRANWPQCCTI